MKRLVRYVLCLCVMLLANSCTHAGGIESLVMPGKLVEGHARYENECSKCHKPFSKKSQGSLCLDCHEDVAADVVNRRGYHGKSGAGESRCSKCHDDHKGRDVNIMQFSAETFDHAMTDYPLEGGHRRVTCASCHKAGDKYREAPSACVECHDSDDVHRGSLGDECADCHEEKGWRQQEFNHDETDFRLRGGHEDVACNDCHAGQRYEGTPDRCFDCHRFNDVHAGRYGEKCGACHRESGWKEISFDHDRNTDFPLTGRHERVNCDTCHGGKRFSEELGAACVGCHRNDDGHKGQYGDKCDSCHRTSGWDKVRFDHGEETEFPLLGRHSDLLCSVCHRGGLGDETLGDMCVDCHGADDVHAGKQGGKCDTCHDERGWGGDVRFEHDMTRFPLIGIHAVTPCEECHLSAEYAGVATTCNDCHGADDTHERRLGPQCESCHNPNAWSLWDFDHDRRTEFRLDGGHAGIDCHACHSKPVSKRISLAASCGGCHREDDIHEGRFGRFCERCHNTESFESVAIR